MNISDIRANFPHTKQNLIYLNHAAISPYCQIHHSSMNEFFDSRSETDIEYFPSLIDNSNDLKTYIAELINGSPENISFVQNTIEGLNLLVDHLEWNSEDEVVIYRKDFPSNVYPFLRLQDLGVKINIVEDHDFIFHEDEYIELINDKTKLVTVSFVQFLTGQVADLEKISKKCEEVNALLVVDTIQGLGAIQLDVTKLKIDYISNGGHKWMMFPMGLGYIYFSDRLKKKFKMHTSGWLNRQTPFDLFNWNNPVVEDGRRFDFGSYPILLIKIARDIMMFRNQINEQLISDKILKLSSYLREKLVNIGLDVIGNESQFKSGIVSFKHSDDRILEHLKENHIIIAEREKVYRISPHFYNTSEEIDRLVEILNKRI